MTDRSLSDSRVWLEAAVLLVVFAGTVLLASKIASIPFFAGFHGPVGEIAALPLIAGSVLGAVFLARRTARHRARLRAQTVVVGMAPVVVLVIGLLWLIAT